MKQQYIVTLDIPEESGFGGGYVAGHLRDLIEAQADPDSHRSQPDGPWLSIKKVSVRPVPRGKKAVVQ